MQCCRKWLTDPFPVPWIKACCEQGKNASYNVLRRFERGRNLTRIGLRQHLGPRGNRIDNGNRDLARIPVFFGIGAKQSVKGRL